MNDHVDLEATMAIEILERLGILKPSQEQLNLIELISSNILIKKRILFDTRLTPREKSCLYWAAKGKTSEEIARLLNIQKVTVDGYKKDILHKLGCNNIAQCVFEGMRFGYLPEESPTPSDA